MKYKKSFNVPSWELLFLVIFIIIVYGLSTSNAWAGVKKLIFPTDEDHETTVQFERLIGTVNNLQKEDYFPNTIAKDKYSLELIGECKKTDEKNCDSRAAKICLVPIGEGRPKCEYVENADFVHRQLQMASNYKITKGEKDIVSFEILE